MHDVSIEPSVCALSLNSHDAMQIENLFQDKEENEILPIEGGVCLYESSISMVYVVKKKKQKHICDKGNCEK